MILLLHYCRKTLKNSLVRVKVTHAAINAFKIQKIVNIRKNDYKKYHIQPLALSWTKECCVRALSSSWCFSRSGWFTESLQRDLSEYLISDISIKTIEMFVRMLTVYCDQNNSYEITINGYQVRKIDEIKNVLFCLCV